MQAQRLTTEQKDFLELLFRNMSGVIAIQKSNGKRFFGKINDNLERDFEITKHDIWFSPHTFRTHAITERNALHSRALFLDFDNVPLEDIYDRIEEHGLPTPNIILWSGGSNCFHVYWLFDTPTSNISMYYKPLAELLGADTAATNKNRVLRLPGMMNYKYGRKTRVVSLRKDYYSTDNIYEVLNEVLDLNYQPRYVPIIPKAKLAQNLNRMSEEQRYHLVKNSVIAEGERNAAVGLFVQYLEKNKKSYFEILNIIRQINQKNFKPMCGDRELVKMVQGWYQRYNDGTYYTLTMGYIKKHFPELSQPGEQYEYIEIKTEEYYDCLPAVILRKHSKKLTGNDLYLLMIIRRYGATTATQLVDNCKLSRATVFNILKKLKKLAIITEEERIIRLQEHHNTFQYVKINLLAIKLFEEKVINSKAIKSMMVLKLYNNLKNVTQDQLAKACGISKRQFIDILQELEQQKLLYRDKVKRKSVYTLRY